MGDNGEIPSNPHQFGALLPRHTQRKHDSKFQWITRLNFTSVKARFDSLNGFSVIAVYVS